MNIGVKLSQIKNEDFIWLIYIFIAISAIISNKYETQYVINHDNKSKKTFKNINVTLLVIAFFIYLYFVLINYENIKELRNSINKKEVLASNLGLIAALLFLVGGIINIWVELNSDTTPDDIDFI